MSIDKAEILQRAIEAVREGKKPMRAKIFAAVYGANRRQYEFNGQYFDTSEQLSEYLKGYVVVDGRPNVIFFRPSEKEVPSYEGD